MTSEGVVLRPARPEAPEGEQFARYLDVASDGLFRMLLGPRCDEIIGRAFLSTGHDLSYEHATLAESDGSLAGMASGYTAAQHAAATDDALEEAAGVRGLQMAAVSLLGRGLLRFIDTVPEGDYYLQAIAIDDDHRGQGIGSRLLDHAEGIARESGCRRFTLDVAEDNEGARRLYERRGMTIEAKSPPIVMTPSSAVYRMVKVL